MQVCFVYFDGLEEPKGLRDLFSKLDSFEVSMRTWLVAYPQTAAHLYFDLQKQISKSDGLVVVPLEPRLLPLHGQNGGPLFDWLEEKQSKLTS